MSDNEHHDILEIEAELDSCPFCGTEDGDMAPRIRIYDLTTGKGYYVECGKCEARGPWEHSPKEAARSWNQRKEKVS